MNPLVSVVIPTYNHAHFLGRALGSVIAQTYTHWEAIVVDNHSTDDTDAVVAGQNDPRIRLEKIHNNGVIAASRNKAMREARGEWIAFLDSDDAWYPEKLAVLMAAAADGDADVLSGDEMQVDTRTGERRRLSYGPSTPDFYRTLLVEGNRLSPSATVVRRSFLVQHGLQFGEAPQYATVEDYDLWLHLARTHARFRFVHEVLGEYVLHATNSSASLQRQNANGEALVRDHVFTVQAIDDPERLWRQVAPRFEVARLAQMAAAGDRAGAVRRAAANVLASPGPYARYALLAVTRRLRRSLG